MFAIAFLFLRVLCDCFKSRRRLEVEVLVLRHQLNVLQQRAPPWLYLTWANRALFVWLYRGFLLRLRLVREPLQALVQCVLLLPPAPPFRAPLLDVLPRHCLVAVGAHLGVPLI